VAGTYVQHGKCYLHANDTWLSYGRVSRRGSPPRIPFLCKILEDGPAEKLNPIGKWQDANTAGKPRECYIIYFGREAPVSRPSALCRSGLADGV
jgi:hypothetical protein